MVVFSLSGWNYTLTLHFLAQKTLAKNLAKSMVKNLAKNLAKHLAQYP